MGAQNSKPLSELTTDELATLLEGLGQAYKGYAGNLRDMGVDGEVVDSLNEADFSLALDSLGCGQSKFLERRVITNKWMALKVAEKDTIHSQQLHVAAKPNDNKDPKDPVPQRSSTSVNPPTVNEIIMIDCDDDDDDTFPIEKVQLAFKKEEQEEDTKPSAVVSNSGVSEKPSPKRKKSASLATNTRSAKKKSAAAAAAKKAPPIPNNEPVQGDATRAPDRHDPVRVASIKIEETTAVKEEADALKASKSGKIPIESLPPDRKERAKARLNANIDPVTKKGRAVFRHAEGITKILGGSGTDSWLFMKKDPPTNPFTGTPNRFISKGEFYVAGSTVWNLWGPVFPGDYGLVEESALRQSDQASFHLFVQCSKTKWDTHYHGPRTEGGYLYVGRYKRMAQDGVFPYSSMSEKSHESVAECFSRYFLSFSSWDFGRNAKFQEEDLIRETVDMADWEEKSEKIKGFGFGERYLI